MLTNVALHLRNLSRFRCVICLFEFVLSKGKGATAMTRNFELAWAYVIYSFARWRLPARPQGHLTTRSTVDECRSVITWWWGGDRGTLPHRQHNSQERPLMNWSFEYENFVLTFEGPIMKLKITLLWLSKTEFSLLLTCLRDCIGQGLVWIGLLRR